MTERIHVTVLSGYLGSGKTTIINNALSQPHGLRLAVLVNEFGPINIDASLITSQREQVIELSNGCVCCSIGDDLSAALTLLQTREDPPEHVLMEASGVAEPARIAMTVGYWPGFALDATVVAADTETIRTRAQDKYVGRLVQSQLRSADIIALTKTDLVSHDSVTATQSWLGTVAQYARIVHTPHGRLPIEILCGPVPIQPTSAHQSTLDQHHAFSTVALRPDGPVDLIQLQTDLGALPTNVHRVKGFVIDAATGQSKLVQCVGKRCNITSIPNGVEPCLVLISTATQEYLEHIAQNLETTWRITKPPGTQNTL
jgi:G3E family GTPase